jgi:hypothetical protein
MEHNLLEIRKKRAFEAGFILYGLIWFLISFITNTSLVIMFFATLPILLGMIILVMLIESDFINMTAISFTPLLLGTFYFLIWNSSKFSIISRTDGPVISVLNIITTYIIYVIVFFIWGNEKRKKEKIIIEHKSPKTENQEDKQIDSTHYNELIKSYQDIKTLDDQEKEHYKMIINNYSKQLELSTQEKEYYKDIADNFHELVENNEFNKEKYKQLSSNYANNIRKYISGLVNEIKRISIDAKTQVISPLEYEKNKQFYEDKIKKLNNRIAEAELSLKVTHENFTVNLRSIEDKCKAINFVIGRVYSDKHGGNKKIRSLLNINRILYNTFSKITSDFDTSQIVHLMLVLKLLQKKLSLYHLHEKDLFQLKKNPKISLKRNTKGQDIILDVLSLNDDDPIKEYHSEASEICLNMINYLEENYRVEI